MARRAVGPTGGLVRADCVLDGSHGVVGVGPAFGFHTSYRLSGVVVRAPAHARAAASTGSRNRSLSEPDGRAPSVGQQHFGQSDLQNDEVAFRCSDDWSDRDGGVQGDQPTAVGDGECKEIEVGDLTRAVNAVRSNS